jgi:hypothetical protein
MSTTSAPRLIGEYVCWMFSLCNAMENFHLFPFLFYPSFLLAATTFFFLFLFFCFVCSCFFSVDSLIFQQLGNLLGQGSFGKTYHATSVNNGEFVVIKQLDPSKFSTKEACEHIQRDYDAVNNISNPYLIQYKSIVREDFVYLFSEFSDTGKESTY